MRRLDAALLSAKLFIEESLLQSSKIFYDHQPRVSLLRAHSALVLHPGLEYTPVGFITLTGWLLFFYIFFYFDIFAMVSIVVIAKDGGAF